MADIAVKSIARNAFTKFDPTATTGDTTTGAASQTVPMSGKKDEQVIILIKNTSTTADDDVLVTVTAGDHPNSKGTALSAVVGDTETAFIGPLSSMDYMQTTGTNKGKIVITAAKATAEGAGVAGDITLCALVIA